MSLINKSVRSVTVMASLRWRPLVGLVGVVTLAALPLAASEQPGSGPLMPGLPDPDPQPEPEPEPAPEPAPVVAVPAPVAPQEDQAAPDEGELPGPVQAAVNAIFNAGVLDQRMDQFCAMALAIHNGDPIPLPEDVPPTEEDPGTHLLQEQGVNLRLFARVALLTLLGHLEDTHELQGAAAFLEPASAQVQARLLTRMAERLTAAEVQAGIPEGALMGFLPAFSHLPMN